MSTDSDGKRDTREDFEKLLEEKEELRRLSDFYSIVAASTPSLIYIYDLRRQQNIWSNSADTGLPGNSFPSSMDSTPLSHLVHMLHQDDYSVLEKRLVDICGAEDGERFSVEYRMRIDSRWHWFHDIGGVFKRDGAGKVIQIICSAMDITEKKEAEEKRLDSERKLWRIVEYNPIPMVVTAENQDIIFVNKKFEETFGYTVSDVPTVAMWWRSAYPDEEYRERVRSAWNGAIEKASSKGEEIEDQTWELRCKNDDKKTARFSYMPLGGINIISIVDITGEKAAESILRNSLREKEILLKEIHHRVKNNLQTISSLLKLQMDNLEDEKAVELIAESEHRIHAIAEVHKYLYESDDLARTDFGKFIRGIADHLLESYNKEMTVTIDYHMERIHIPIDTAVPIGIVTNEIITNALKHAFPNDRRGTISIVLLDLGHEFELLISNDGVDFPEHINFRNNSTIGLDLIYNLISGQLKGEISMSEGPGATFRIRLPRSRE